MKNKTPPLKPEWFDKIEKFCGANNLNFNSAHDRMIAMDLVPEDGKVKCSCCLKIFNYSITGHIINYHQKMCNTCYFAVALNLQTREKLVD